MGGKQVAVDREALVEPITEDGTRQVALDLAYQRHAIVNVVFYGLPSGGDGQWVLVDAGVPGSAASILQAAKSRFGETPRPGAIVLTHGHFDHVGALEELVDRWDVPVYAHELEIPYLNGTASYPPPDPSVGGGMMSSMAGLYPRGPVNVGDHLHPLPEDGTIPIMPRWKWIHVPGHTPGQIALWRESDRTLIAADAFITTRQESAYAVMTQQPELHGPPMYYTQNWEQARESVERLAALEPELVIAGHGQAMQGEAMREALRTLARDFDEVAVPKQGEYVDNPVDAESGSAYHPPT